MPARRTSWPFLRDRSPGWYRRLQRPETHPPLRGVGFAWSPCGPRRRPAALSIWAVQRLLDTSPNSLSATASTLRSFNSSTANSCSGPIGDISPDRPLDKLHSSPLVEYAGIDHPALGGQSRRAHHINPSEKKRRPDNSTRNFIVDSGHASQPDDIGGGSSYETSGALNLCPEYQHDPGSQAGAWERA